MTVVQELDRSLFDGYVKPKSVEVTAIVRKGILDPQMDWFETPKPTGSFNWSWQECIADCVLEIRPYMFEMLLFLVGIHAHVSSVSEGLLERTLNALIDDIAEESYRSFKQVKKFGMGGMLRVS